MTNHHDLMQRHVDTLFTRDAQGDLIRVNEPEGGLAPRFFLGRTRHGVVQRFRQDVDTETRRELSAAVQGDLLRDYPLDEPPEASRYAAILSQSAPISAIWTGPAFCFPHRLPESKGTARITEANARTLQFHFRDWIPDVRRCQPMIGLAIDGHVVSLCCSVRQTSFADEAGVETAPAYRGRNYARQVTTAWARAVSEANRVPMYSTSWTNTASRAVARKIGLVLFGSDLHLT
jgi:RimJ/RimL family protein N-acetyltransferase